MKYLRVVSTVENTTKDKITSTINGFWGSFYKEGVQHTFIGYGFLIDTGNKNPVLGNNVSYRPY